MPLHYGDQLLFAGRARARDRQLTLLGNANILTYLLTGRERPGGWIWQKYGKKIEQL
jgi:hypothetical protein